MVNIGIRNPCGCAPLSQPSTELGEKALLSML
jgi:hypothetical protein